MLEQDFFTESLNTAVFGGNGETVVWVQLADWNDYLSSVCEKILWVFSHANHELLNIGCVGAQYKKGKESGH